MKGIFNVWNFLGGGGYFFQGDWKCCQSILYLFNFNLRRTYMMWNLLSGDFCSGVPVLTKFDRKKITIDICLGGGYKNWNFVCALACLNWAWQKWYNIALGRDMEYMTGNCI